MKELLERSGATTSHLADENIARKMDDMDLENARRIAREVLDEYRLALKELIRLEERFPHANTEIVRLFSRAVRRLADVRWSLRLKVPDIQLTPLKTRYELTDKGLMILPGEEIEEQASVPVPTPVPEIKAIDKALALVA